jgi:hypothetical protein
MQKISYMGIPECLLLSNGEIELVVTTLVGPRILCYRFVKEENVFGELPDIAQPNSLGLWKPYGGHRLWAAPEKLPQTYYPDNDPVEVTSLGAYSVRLRAPVERETNLQKEMRITLEEHGSGIAIEHIITNYGDTAVELAPWALTIMRTGGTAIIPQEPYRSHQEYLLSARPIVLWHFTDLTDPRWKIGKSLIQLSTDSKRESPQKIGALNKQGWIGCYLEETLFTKEFEYLPNAIYPDYGCNCEIYTAGSFLELESLGMMQVLQPGKSATHQERWRLFSGITLSNDEEKRAEVIGQLFA